ncbi:hypothetical protein B0H14DRAFT_2572806 [Mycena olivaceomarginata]|nr:hypothetical protein B0H14DRAFT_2572806 [Mycena olivaceomarginata]
MESTRLNELGSMSFLDWNFDNDGTANNGGNFFNMTGNGSSFAVMPDNTVFLPNAHACSGDSFMKLIPDAASLNDLHQRLTHQFLPPMTSEANGARNHSDKIDPAPARASLRLSTVSQRNPPKMFANPRIIAEQWIWMISLGFQQRRSSDSGVEGELEILKGLIGDTNWADFIGGLHSVAGPDPKYVPHQASSTRFDADGQNDTEKGT